MKTITTLYSTLKEHQEAVKDISLKQLFKENSDRAETLSCRLGGVYFDYSKNHITQETLLQLAKFAEEKQIAKEIQALISGQKVNNTEQRAALHTTLRFQGQAKTENERFVEASKQQMANIVKKIHSGKWLGFSGKAITTVINIGIGGSDLGPRMASRALQSYHKNIDVRFVANVDGTDLYDTLHDCDASTTLFIISSKSFNTLETLENANSANQWLHDHQCPTEKTQQHFIAVSTNNSAAINFGITPEHILPMQNWTGGRYSLWSTIGLPVAIAIGMDHFNDLLAGANIMDNHYQSATTTKNMPIIAALLTFWYSHFWGANAHAVLPYAQRMNHFTAYLQQLDMESLGKSVSKSGAPIDYPTGNIIWGTEGTNGQHSFHQLFHQGTQLIPIDFIMVNKPMSSLSNQHKQLQACCISQSQALLKGKTLAEVESELKDQGMNDSDTKALAPHKVVPGNRPSNTIVIDELTPKNLGSLIAFYEHKTHALSVLLDINPFDQWGVELGKQLGKPIYQSLLDSTENPTWDASTERLIALVNNKN